MNKETKTILITGLEQMLDGQIAHKNLGISANLCTHLPLYHEELAYDLVRDCGEKWVVTSGNRWYPIPFSKGSSEPKWEGINLRYRMSLIRFIIDYLEFNV
tara:strand:- start:433 stop:735 length:303 start_codon:yes stop_codon:yes gene_type:complete